MLWQISVFLLNMQGYFAFIRVIFRFATDEVSSSIKNFAPNMYIGQSWVLLGILAVTIDIEERYCYHNWMLGK